MLGDTTMHPSSQLIFDRLQGQPHAVAPGTAEEKELPILVFRTDVGEAEKRERFGLTPSAAHALHSSKTTKLDQPRLLRVKRERELRHPLTQLREKRLCIVVALDTNHDVVGVAHDDDAAIGVAPPPMRPEVEGVVQIHVRQERGDHSPYAKGNFCFERVIRGWRDCPKLDLRRKQ